MVGESPVLDRLRAVAAHLDDEALAALASKGLVRRARKDLEAQPPTLIGPHGNLVRFQVEDCTVDLAESPAQSKCSCPAAGACRHILAAFLFLRGLSPLSPPPLPFPARGEGGGSGVGGEGVGGEGVGGEGVGERRGLDSPSGPVPQQHPPSREEIFAVTDQELQKWAGKALVRKATQALAVGLQSQFEGDTPLVVRFPTWNVACRWMPGVGLAGMICSCHALGPCEHRVAAVLAYQAAHGQRQLDVQSAVLEASAGAARTREEVLQSVGVVLREMVGLGLSRLSRSTEDRLRTLAVSAHGVDLPRLERVLRALADEVTLSLNRDAQAASDSLLGTASRIEALRSALVRPTPELVGVHRSLYEKVGDIELIGLGARQWRTRSGYIGLTVYFWDKSAKNWATWTVSRPTSVPDFDPEKQYTQDGPWIGCNSPHEASRSILRVQGAWRNRMGRLSARSSTHALLRGPSDPSMVPGFINWAALTDRARGLFGGGLRERREQDEIVLLRPQAWGPSRFDPVRQELVRPVLDDAVRPLPLVLPHTAMTAEAVNALEQYQPSSGCPVLGLLRLDGERLWVEPIAFYVGQDVFNLTLDVSTRPKKKSAARQAAAANEGTAGEDEREENTDLAASASPLGLLLTRMAERLESAAEGGLRSVRDIEVLRNLANQADALGLASCARPLARLADQLDQVRLSVEADTAAAAGTLLRAYYVVRFAAAQEIVATATASLG